MLKLIHVLSFAGLLGATCAQADSSGGIDLDINGQNALANSLTALKDRRVLLKLNSGADISGKLSQVGDNAVYVESLREPGEFFSAWIPLSGIAAVVFRVNDGRTATAVTVSAD